MSMTFADLVEEVREHSVEEWTQLKDIIDHEFSEEAEEQIYLNHLDAMRELEEGTLRPFTDVDDLMRQLDAE